MENIEIVWHGFHNALLSVLEGTFDQRASEIILDKPREEVALRLRLLKRVRGPLPPVIRRTCVTLVAEHQKLAAAYKSLIGSSDRRVWGRVGRCEKRVSELRAKLNGLVNASEEVRLLHAEECPDCPWDGKTIFPTQTPPNQKASND